MTADLVCLTFKPKCEINKFTQIFTKKSFFISSQTTRKKYPMLIEKVQVFQITIFSYTSSCPFSSRKTRYFFLLETIILVFPVDVRFCGISCPKLFDTLQMCKFN